jgi:hypothetical protein
VAPTKYKVARREYQSDRWWIYESPQGRVLKVGDVINLPAWTPKDTWRVVHTEDDPDPEFTGRVYLVLEATPLEELSEPE